MQMQTNRISGKRKLQFCYGSLNQDSFQWCHVVKQAACGCGGCGGGGGGAKQCCGNITF
jgi:hypothetical protein